jgi:glycerol-3-phosphate acyltransferase PlsX
MQKFTIAVDVMGGDYAPLKVVKGAVRVTQQEENVDVILVGNVEEIKQVLKKLLYDYKRVRIEPAQSVVQMYDKPTVVFREKKDSSIVRCIELVKNRECDAFISAGNSGAVMAAAIAYLGKLKGILRPALGMILPTLNGNILLIDAGVNVDCRAVHLLQFAIMGYVYKRLVLGVEKPRIGLVSNGTEPNKGNTVTKEAHNLIKKKFISFIGNIEGNDIFTGKTDVVVCDGFLGNVVLKVSESIPEIVVNFLRIEIKKSFWYKLGYLFAKPAFRVLRKKIDYTEFGGAPLLGVKGAGIIAHGRSNEQAIANAVMRAAFHAQTRLGGAIEKAIEEYMILHTIEEKKCMA